MPTTHDALEPPGLRRQLGTVIYSLIGLAEGFSGLGLFLDLVKEGCGKDNNAYNDFLEERTDTHQV